MLKLLAIMWIFVQLLTLGMWLDGRNREELTQGVREKWEPRAMGLGQVGGGMLLNETREFSF